jgi:G3E family GTPase
MSTDRIPATILTGFLGAGKTTLLKRVLGESHGLRIAVIENEFGEENVDGEILVSDDREQIVQLSNGCVCCTIREDLRASLQSLADKRREGLLAFDRVVIETTGLADPGPVAQTFFLDEPIAERYLLDSVLTLVDAKHAQATLDDRREARVQVGFADQIFISKAELVAPEELAALERRLANMNPRAPRKTVHFGDVPIAEVFDLHSFNLTAKLDVDPAFLADEKPAAHAHGCDHDHSDGSACDHARHDRHDDVKSFVFRSPRAFDGARLRSLMAALVNGYGERLLRYKGVLHVHGVSRKVVFQGVHQLMSSDVGPPWPADEPRVSKLVFIGVDVPRDMVIGLLERCLV